MLQEETKLQREELKLDRRLRDYDRLLTFVDSSAGKNRGFRQVLADWKQVRKETEECNKDLLRMGWTGD